MTAESDLIEQFVANEITADDLAHRLTELDRRPVVHRPTVDLLPGLLRAQVAVRNIWRRG